MLSVSLLVNSRRLVVKFWEHQKLNRVFNCVWGVSTPTPALFKGRWCAPPLLMVFVPLQSNPRGGGERAGLFSAVTPALCAQRGKCKLMQSSA